MTSFANCCTIISLHSHSKQPSSNELDWANYVLSFILKFLSKVDQAYWQSGRMQAKLLKDYKNKRWLLKKKSTLHKQHPKGQLCKVEAHPCHNHLWLTTNQMVYIHGQNFTLSSCKTIQLPNCSKKSWWHPNMVVHIQLMWAYILCLSHAKSFEMAPFLGSSTIFEVLGALVLRVKREPKPPIECAKMRIVSYTIA